MASPRLYRLTGVLADAYEGYFSYRLSGPGPTFEVLDERTIPVGSDSLRPTVLGLKVIRAGVRLTPAHPLVNVVRANITVDARTKSIKVYASKYGEPTAAHVIAYGTTYNVPDGTNSVSTGTLAAINLSAGETANVAVLPYTGQNGTGTVGTLARDTAFQDEGYPGGEVPPDVARTTQLANFTGGLQAGGVAVAVGQSVRTSDTVTFAAVSSPGVGSFNSGTFTAGITSRGRQVPTIQWGVGAPTSATPGVDGDIYVDVS